MNHRKTQRAMWCNRLSLPLPLESSRVLTIHLMLCQIPSSIVSQSCAVFFLSCLFSFHPYFSLGTKTAHDGRKELRILGDVVRASARAHGADRIAWRPQFSRFSVHLSFPHALPKERPGAPTQRHPLARLFHALCPGEFMCCAPSQAQGPSVRPNGGGQCGGATAAGVVSV